MAEMKWTPAQWDAISARGGTLLVSAAAGSGKTAVLTERAVRRMLDDEHPIEADRMLVVTFTRAAAQEMKQRLIAKLLARIEAEPENAAARRQRILLDRATIGTIHSLCFELLRENFQKLGLPAGFRIGDEQETAAMREEAVCAALEEGYQNPEDHDFFALVELMSTRSGDTSLAEMTLQVLDFARAHPFYLDWLDERLALFGQEKAPAQSVWGRVIFTYAAQSIEAAREQCTEALAWIESNDTLEPYRPAIAAYEGLFAALDALCKSENWDGLFDALQGFEHPRLAAARKACPEQREQLKRRRDRIKEAVLRLQERLFDASEAEFADDIADLTPKISRLFELVRRTDGWLSEKKRAVSIVDFSDLEQMAVTLLMRRTPGGDQPTELAKQYAARYDEIMVDEYQDVNAAQDMILTALSNGNNLFLVGDVKQSVYRFRQARPELFLDRADSYPDYERETPHFPAKISLNGNFRSRREITDVINQTFFALMRKDAAELDYDTSQALVPMADYVAQEGCGVELHLLDPDALPDDAIAAEQEAQYAARQVAKLLRSGFLVTEGGDRRPVEPRDVCILLRSPKNRARLYRQALTDAGVDSTVDSAGGFLHSPEILAVCNLLHAIDNPVRDLELVGAMLSPLLGFTDDELAAIRLNSPSGSIYAAVRAAGETDPHCAALVELLARLRRASATMSAAQLLTELYARTDFELLVRGMKNGEQKALNLALLARYADHYHALGYRGLGAFLRILDRLEEREEDLAPARVGGGGNAVTISSIHRAKGLEWPVVLLCDTARTHSFYQNDLIAPTILHAELGFACVRRDPVLKKQYPTVPLTAVRLESERALLSEELRVLYVAMTRAREKLIITASIKKAADKLLALPARSADGRLSAAWVLDCRSNVQWLLAAFSQREDFALLCAGDRATDAPALVCADGSSLCAPQRVAAVEGKRVEPIDPARLGRLKERVGFVYPFARAAVTPAKLPVSQLTHGERRLFEQKPSFLRGGALTGAEKGSAVHAFMQLCVYRSAQKNPAAELARLREGGWLTQQQADAVDLRQIADFFASELARRIFAADKLLREFKFMAPASVSPLAVDYVTAQGEATMLQGIADCIFIEGERATVLDYKTDRVGDEQGLIDRYAPQLLLYRDMLGTALDVPVREGILWSFALGREIRVFMG